MTTQRGTADACLAARTALLDAEEYWLLSGRDGDPIFGAAADQCEAAAKMSLLGAADAGAVLAICADLCDMAADLCDGAGDEHLSGASAACRACSASCREVAVEAA